jgi:uncharacterized membrane protein
MRKILLSIILLSVGLCKVNAGELSRFSSQFTTIYTNSTSYTLSNSAATNVQTLIPSVSHTYQLFATTVGTNSVTATLDRTIDSANWIPATTNTISTNGIAEYTFTGKWTQARWRISAANSNNATVLVVYMGQ